MGDLKDYYEDGEPSLVLMGKTTKGEILRVTIPLDLIKAIMAKEGPIQVEITDPATGQSYSFYRGLHDMKEPVIYIPKDMTNDFRLNQEVAAKIKPLPIWDFVNQLEGKALEAIRLNNDGVLVANLGGKEIPIKSFEYDYRLGEAYVGFQVKDIAGKVGWFRVYDNGFEEPRFTIKEGNSFDTIQGIDYDPKRHSLTIEYDHHNPQNSFTSMRFMEPPDKIDLDARRIPEEMRLRWKEAVESGKTYKMGEIGAEVGAKIAEKEYNVKVSLSGDTHGPGPDGQFTRDSEPCVLEVKSTADESKLGIYLKKAADEVRGRDKAGIAVSVYIDKDTGFFEYKHEPIPKTQDASFTGFYPMDASTQDQPPLGLIPSTGNNGQAPNMPLTQGRQPGPSYVDPSQSRDQPQRSLNRSTTLTQNRGQKLGSKTTNSDPNNSSNNIPATNPAKHPDSRNRAPSRRGRVESI
jgi:hypothetical protein